MPRSSVRKPAALTLPVSQRAFKSVAPVIEDPGTPVAEHPPATSCCSDCWAGMIEKIMPASRAAARRGSYVRKNRRQMLPQRSKEDITDTYTLDEAILGSGAFGSVRRAVRKRSKKERVVKSLNKSEIHDPDALHNEILIQSDLDHPHICRIYDTFETTDVLHIVLEFCKGGDLSDAIYDADRFTEHDARHFMIQILKAVNYMHNRAIAHRDLKPENFLLNSGKATPFTENHLKLIDFGFAQTFKPGERTMTTKCGTPHFLAPEIFFEDYYDEKCDLWSCGVIMYLFLCGDPPFDGEEIENIVERAKRGKPSFEAEIWENISPMAKLAIMQMCHAEPEHRFSAAMALETPWISKCDELSVCKRDSLKGDTIVERMRKFHQSSTLKKVGAHLVAYSMSDNELETMRQTFMAMDKDGDGTLSLEEVKAAMRDHANLAEMEALFAQADTDDSGRLEWTEFLSALATSKQLSCREACWEAFRVFDKDGDRKISLAEVQDVLGREGKEVSVDEVVSADTDGDGTIDFEEFLALMSSGIKDQSGSNGSKLKPSPVSMANRRKSAVSAGLKLAVADA